MTEELDSRFHLGSDEENVENYTSPELDSIFQKPVCLEQEEAVALNKNYILYLSGVTEGSENKVGLGLSSCESRVYSIGSCLNCTNTLPAEPSSIVDVRFAPDNHSLFYVCGSKGTVTLWDLRDTKKFAQQYKDTSDPKKKNLHEKRFSSFDVNSSGRFLCAGTEVTDGDAFLLFWDTRQNSLLGGYWDCHTDDVTQVKFHPSEADCLVTGSTDGLINLFDISQRDENEALLQSFNTESSVEKLSWHLGAQKEDTTVACVTHTADVQLWRTEDSAPYNTFSRTNISKALQISSDELSDTLYMADVHSTSEDGHLFFLAGSNIANGRCLRSGTCYGGKLNPRSYFDGNKQIVRCSWFNHQDELLVTGGEAGILSIWKSGSSKNSQNVSQLKAPSKLKTKPHKTKTKPY